jgi:hypothetical protein
VVEQPVVEEGSTGISPSRVLGVPGGVVGIEVTHKEVGGVEGERVMPTLQLICGDCGGAHVCVGDDKGCGLGVVCAGAQLQSEGLILVRIPVAGECTVGIPLTHEDSHASAGLEGQPRSKDGVVSRDAGGPLRGGAGLLEQEKVHRGLVLGSYVPQHSQRGSRGAVDVELERL